MLGVTNYKKETDFLFALAALQTLSLADFYSLGRVHLEFTAVGISSSNCSIKPLFENMKVINQYKTDLQMVWKIDAMKVNLLVGCNSKQLQKLYVLVLVIFL